jgi:hypothetical protein
LQDGSGSSGREVLRQTRAPQARRYRQPGRRKIPYPHLNRSRRFV